ncbi:MAG: histidine triad nucleotide-binding protein [Anaerolineae bacterium]|nr:histidine triad nucleotide-binding protein [Anaerolineae bacterium]
MPQDCIFCKIVAGDIKATKLYQDESVTVFKDINPQAPTHILVIPNQHIEAISEASPEDQVILGKLMLTAAHIAREESVADNGYRLVVNNGRDGGQTVFHLHVHLLAGRPMRWPPG